MISYQFQKESILRARHSCVNRNPDILKPSWISAKVYPVLDATRGENDKKEAVSKS
jgi:hypothetical protein